MEAYTIFAKVYDEFMRDIPYEQWADMICAYIENINFGRKAILELGCGTGSFTKCLVERGHRVKGMDFSEKMLKYARRKLPRVTFEQNDIRAFKSDTKYWVMVSVCDVVNYMTDCND